MSDGRLSREAITLIVQGILMLSAAGAVLWFCTPKNGKPSVSTVLAPYVAVAVTMSSVVGLGAIFLGLVRMVSNG